MKSKTASTSGRELPLISFFLLTFLLAQGCGSNEPSITLQTAGGDEVSALTPNDQEFHVIVNIGSPAGESNVRMELIAVETEAGNNQSVLTEDYDVGGINNQVDFTVTLPRPWPVGSYRVDAYVDDSLTTSRTFMIE